MLGQTFVEEIYEEKIFNPSIHRLLMVIGSWLMGAWLVAHGSRRMAHGSWPRGAGLALGAPGSASSSGPRARAGVGPALLGHEP